LIVVSPPRAGSTLLFETLALSPGLFSIGGESHGVFEAVPALQPANRGWESNELTAADATHEVAGTSSDRESPWLALRESASASSQLLAELPDGTGLRVLSRNKRWMRVQVLEGQDQGSIGWVNGRWVSHR